MSSNTPSQESMDQPWAYAAWVLALTGTLASLFISEIMSLAPNTIRSMCRRIRDKLGVRRIDDVIVRMQRQCHPCVASAELGPKRGLS